MEREGTASAMPIDFGRVLEAGDGDLDLSINDLEIDVS
jgi:hypothetical protein